MRKLGIDYGDARVGVAITDELGITAQGLETIHHNGNDKLVLKRLEELFNQYQIDTIVIGVPINMNGTKTERVEVTEKFIHKLKCKFNKIKIEKIACCAGFDMIWRGTLFFLCFLQKKTECFGTITQFTKT